MSSAVLAITVTFNPELEVFSRQLEALCDQCDILLVDNGSDAAVLAEIEKLSEREGCQLLALGENLGIAAAQNRGVERVTEFYPDCEYLLFLDHDSIPPAGFVAAMTGEYQRLAKMWPAIGVLGPAIYEPRARDYYGFHRLRGLRYQRVSPADMTEDAIACTTVNSAGTFTTVSVMTDVGPFDEGLFIDHVETEWCFRAREHGYQLFGTRRVELEHRMGDDVLEIKLGITTLHLPYRSPGRHRYLMRNSVAMLRRPYIPLVWKAYCIAKIGITLLLFGLLSNERVLQMKAILAGIGDGMRGRSGRIEPAPERH